MRIKIVFLVLHMLIPKIIFAQYFDYFNYGFNASEYISYNHDGRMEEVFHEYILMNNPLFSNALVRGPLDKLYGWNGIRYEFVDNQDQEDIWRPIKIVNLFDGITGPSSYYHDSKREKPNGTTILEDGTIMEDKNFSSILIRRHKSRLITLRLMTYYNLPVSEIEDYYLAYFVKSIFVLLEDDYIVSMRKSWRTTGEQEGDFDLEHGFLIMLPYFKKQELAIIRNCLFAKHGYNFRTSFWRRFFERYYSSFFTNYSEYKGKYTNSEVLSQFTDDEKWLLDLVLKYEKKQGNHDKQPCQGW